MNTDPPSDKQGLNGPQPGPPRSVAAAGLLGCCVIVSGASVMIYEFLAVRFLARYFGGSLDVWASVIAVLLAALSLGYALGGVLADKYPSWKPLGVSLIFAGVTGFLIEPIAAVTGAYLIHVDTALTWHPYIAAALSSFLPVLALGTVLPQAIKLRARSIDRVGTTTGWIAALSTLGSILGVLLAVRVLIPYVGVRQALNATSLTLIILGLVPFVIGRRLAASLALLALISSQQAIAQIIFDDFSAYHHILVQDIGKSRLLRFDESVQSTMSLYDPSAGGFEYTDFFHVPIVLDPTIRSVLFVGLGGGSGPKAFLRDYPNIKIDVSEIDPMVLRIAREYFAVPEHPNLNIIIQDGRVHLQRSQATYGAIVLDAYGSGQYGPFLPYHLGTKEFFELAAQRLTPRGSLVYNVMGVYRGLNSKTVRGIQATLETVFSTVYAFRAKTSLNTVFVAVKAGSPSTHPGDMQHGPAWPRGPWLEHPLSADQLARLTRTLMDKGVIRLEDLDQRVRQISRVQNAPRTRRIYTDDFAPIDLAPQRRAR